MENVNVNNVNAEDAATTATDVTTKDATVEVKTYTEEDFNKALQSEVDKRVSQALKTAERKADARIKEAQKLAKMNEQQRYEYELETREKAIAEKQKALALAENKATAASILAERGISAKLVDFVVAEDATTMQDNINMLEAEFKASVKAEVEKRLATSTPKKNLPTDRQITKEMFNKMKLTERVQLFNSNPDLYKMLTSN